MVEGADIIGRTAAALMDQLDEKPELANGKIIECGIVVIVDGGDDSDSHYTQVRCSDNVYTHQLGLFTEAVDVLRNGDKEDA